MNKKGMFFTIGTIFLIGLLILTIQTQREEPQSISTRISTMNYFVEDYENDLQRVGEIVGKRALVAITNDIIKQKEYRTNVKKDFVELFLLKTLDNNPNKYMKNTSINDWINQIELAANKLNLNFYAEIKEVTLTQSTPFYIDVKIKTNNELKGKLAEFNFNSTITSRIHIEGLEAPIYSLSTYNQISRIIRFADKENVLDNTLKGYFMHNPSAPSYLNRLEGKTTGSEYGIESLVNIQELADKNMDIKRKSIADYIYFSELNPTAYQIQNTKNWFMLDTEHADYYNLKIEE